jgi:hypothetical protein
MTEAAALGHGRHAWPADGCCANCGTQLAGHWCHACGQRAADHHRSLRHLAFETIEGLTHADGRLWRTLRLLALCPARLTRDYLMGRRASEIPPLRLFFVTLLLVFASGSLFGGLHVNLHPSSPGDLADAHKAIGKISIDGLPGFSAWLQTHLFRAVSDPEAVVHNMSEWGERFAVLLLPLSALGLRLLFPLRWDVKLYDHMIFTMHSLSFAGFAWIGFVVARKLLHLPGPLPALFLLAMPVHLFVHMRGFYRTGLVSTLFRMVLLALFTMGIFAVLLAGLAAFSMGTLEG